MAKNGERGVITAVLQLNSMPRFEHILLYQFSSENIFKTFMNWFFSKGREISVFCFGFRFCFKYAESRPVQQMWDADKLTQSVGFLNVKCCRLILVLCRQPRGMREIAYLYLNYFRVYLACNRDTRRAFSGD